MKVTKVSATLNHYWEVSVKYLDEIAVGLLRLKKNLPRRNLTNLQVCLKDIRNRLLQVYYISWKFWFRKYVLFDLDRCSEKKNSCLGLIFENPFDGFFQLIDAFIFAQKCYENFYTCIFQRQLVCWIGKALNYNQKQLLKVFYKKIFKLAVLRI